MDKKVAMTAAIVVAFLLSSSILVLFYNQTEDDKEINLVARVNTEGSGIYIDAKYVASDFIEVDSDGEPVKDDDGNVIMKTDFWRGKVFGTPGSTSIQHIQLQTLVTGMGLKFTPYSEGVDQSSTTSNVYYVQTITNAAAFEAESNKYIDGGIIWEPQYHALLLSEKRRCNSMMTTGDFDPGHACCVVGASHEFITSHSDETVRFLAGYIESVDWVNAALADKSSDDYEELLNIAQAKTGMSRAVLAEAMDSVVYTYGGNGTGDSADAPLMSLESDITKLVNNLYKLDGVLRVKLKDAGFSSSHELAQRFVNDGYLSQAMAYEKSASGYGRSTVTVAVISGDVHQIAIHVGIEKGFFSEYGINVNTTSAANGAGVATSLQNGEADFGFLGAPPMTITAINGMLIKS